MKTIFKGSPFGIVWNIIDRITEQPFDFTGMNVEVGLYSNSCKKVIDSYTIANGTITATIKADELQSGVYGLMCRYSNGEEQAYCTYRNAFQITVRTCNCNNTETIELTSIASHIDPTNEEDLDDEGKLIAEELFKVPFRLPELTADRAIADEHGNRIPDTYVTRSAVAEHIRQTYNQQFLENPPLITEGYITPEMLSEETRQMLEATGQKITNLSDGEDISTINGVLKFANKQYNPNSYSGMGRIHLRKNIVGGVNLLTQAMINKPNTIYIIQYDYDLQGAEITIPANCVLDFQGGILSNGNIKFNNSLIKGDIRIYCDIISGSDLKNDKVIIDWFGAKPDDPSFDNAVVFERILKIQNIGDIIVPPYTYYCKSFMLPDYANLKGVSKTKSTLYAIADGKNYTFDNFSTYNTFIAIRSPRSTISNLRINGGAKEGCNNIGIGTYQAGFLLSIENVVFEQCSIGYININSMGGIVSVLGCEFLEGCKDFAIRSLNIGDKLSIVRCNFESIISEYANIISIEGNSNKGTYLENNRFEANVVKSIYYFSNAGYNTVIKDNLYLLPNMTDESSIYTINSSAYVVNIDREFYQNLGSIQHIGLFSAAVYSVEFFNCAITVNDNTFGYYDDSNNFITYKTEGYPKIIIHNSYKGIEVYPYPTYNTPDYELFKLPYASVIANMRFISHGADRIINIASPVQRLIFETYKLLLRKGDEEYDLSYLFQAISGETRPNNPIEGSVFFDKSKNKPIWWNGTKWVDATGTEVQNN